MTTTSSAALLLLVLALPAGAISRALTASPLATLGVSLQLAMPGLSSQNLYVPGFAPLTADAAAKLKLPASAVPFPAAWNPEKAAVLLERAKAEKLLAPSGHGVVHAVGGASAEQAKPLLEKINAVLTDFSPQELRDMPAEKLHQLVAVIMDQSGSFASMTDASLPGAVHLSRKRAEVIRSKLTPSPKMDQPYANVLDGHEMPRYTQDVPGHARFLDGERPVMRHYLSQERLDAVLKTGTLGNAVLPYVQRTHGVWHDYYETLTGLFLTLPSVKGGAVGVRDENASFVDLVIDAAFPLIEIEPGRIYLVPMPGMPESWVKEIYLKWIAGDAGALSYHGQLPRLEQNGGPGPFVRLPVKVVGSSRP
jgi:hypothetical protein